MLLPPTVILLRYTHGLSLTLLFLLASWLPTSSFAATQGGNAVLQVSLDQPSANVAAGNTYQPRALIGGSVSVANDVVLWMSLDSVLAANFGQNEELQFVNANSAGIFVTQATVFSGVSVPARSVVWLFGTLQAGSTFARTATVRIPNGALNGTSHRAQVFARAGNSASMPSSLVRTTVTTATPRAAVAVHPGAGWQTVAGVPSAAAGSEVEFVLGAPTAGFNNGAEIGTESLYMPRGWILLQPICAAAGDSAAACIARVTSITDGGVVDPAFDPDAAGPLPAQPAVIWNLDPLSPGASIERRFRMQLDAGIAMGTTVSVSAQLASARSAPVSASRDFVLSAEATPLASFALGERQLAIEAITAGADDLPTVITEPDASFELLLQIENSGSTALGDSVHTLRIPSALRLVDVALPPSTAGRVFYSTTSAFSDPSTPPPIDLSAVIGNSNIPITIDASGNTFWQPLDSQPPANLSAVRWLALYHVSLPAPGASALSRIALRETSPFCNLVNLDLLARSRVHSFDAGSGETAIQPAPLTLSDSEPVRFANSAPSLDVIVSGSSTTFAGDTTPAQIDFAIRNTGATTLIAPMLLVTWPTLSINGAPKRPTFVSASGGTIDASLAAAGEVAIMFDPIPVGASRTGSVTLRYPTGVVADTLHTIRGDVSASHPTCNSASAFAVHTILLLGQPNLQVVTASNQPTLAPGGELAFTGTQRNTGNAVATGAFVFGQVPSGSVFRSAELPPGRRLLCSAPPQDADLPADLSQFNANLLLTRFVSGTTDATGWSCPHGETTTWIALALDDEALTPPSFITASDEAWTLHLRNDETRDEPNVVQTPSAINTGINFQLGILASGLLPTISNLSGSVVQDNALSASCDPPLLSTRTPLDYLIPTSNAQPPITFSLIAGSFPGCVALDANGRLTGGSNMAGEFDFGIRVVDDRAQQVDVQCRLRVIVAGIFRDGLEANPLPPEPPGPGPCPP